MNTNRQLAPSNHSMLNRTESELIGILRTRFCGMKSFVRSLPNFNWWKKCGKNVSPFVRCKAVPVHTPDLVSGHSICGIRCGNVCLPCNVLTAGGWHTPCGPTMLTKLINNAVLFSHERCATAVVPPHPRKHNNGQSQLYDGAHTMGTDSIPDFGTHNEHTITWRNVRQKLSS